MRVRNGVNIVVWPKHVQIQSAIACSMLSVSGDDAKKRPNERKKSRIREPGTDYYYGSSIINISATIHSKQVRNGKRWNKSPHLFFLTGCLLHLISNNYFDRFQAKETQFWVPLDVRKVSPLIINQHLVDKLSFFLFHALWCHLFAELQIGLEFANGNLKIMSFSTGEGKAKKQTTYVIY